MQRINSLNKRLGALEAKASTGHILLHFADGSTRSIRLKNPLQCFIAAANRVSCRCEGAPMPTSPHDELIELLGRATKVDCQDISGKFDTEDVFISNVVHGMCQDAVQKAKEKIQ